MIIPLPATLEYLNNYTAESTFERLKFKLIFLELITIILSFCFNKSN